MTAKKKPEPEQMKRTGDLVSVRLLKRDAPYEAGEVVSVPAARAKRWLKEGIAEHAR